MNSFEFLISKARASMNHSIENDYHHNALDQINMSNSTFAAVKVVFPQDWAFVPLYNWVGIAIVSENVC